MFGEKCERFFQIVKSNLKRTYLIHIVLACAMLLLTPVIFGLNDLDAAAAAMPMEMFVSLVGILLLTPLFLPEQNRDIRDLVETKAMPPFQVHGLRLLIPLCTMAVLVAGMVLVLLALNCRIEGWNFFLGTFATAFFLGSLGLLAYALSDTIAIGYMIPLVYYVFQLMTGSKYLKPFVLFTLSQAGMREKYWLLGGGCVCLTAAFLCRAVKKRLR